MNSPYDPTPFGPTRHDDPAEWAAEWRSYERANARAAAVYRTLPIAHNRARTALMAVGEAS